MKGVLVILFYLALGEGISMLMHKVIPGNVIGMVLFFISLQLKIVKEETIKPICDFLTQNMTLMFLPPAVGLIAAYELLGNHIITIILAIIVSTLLVMAVVGKLQDILGKKDEGDNQ
ncbi:MAG: CidA/LrgA family protein [Bacteroidales bacterium]|nr:CidA/LrgA family protein [Bacteroidales bacterium]